MIGLKVPSILNLLPPLSPTVTIIVFVVAGGVVPISTLVVLPFAFALRLRRRDPFILNGPPGVNLISTLRLYRKPTDPNQKDGLGLGKKPTADRLFGLVLGLCATCAHWFYIHDL